MSLTDAQPDISRANDLAVWPWQAEPYRLWSLLDMEQTNISEALKATIAAMRIVGLREPNVSAVIPFLGVMPEPKKKQRRALREDVIKGIDEAIAAYGRSNLPSRLINKLSRLRRDVDEVKAKQIDMKSVRTRLTDFAEDLVDELGEPIFLYIPAEERALFEQKEPLFGQAVADAFPDGNRDIAAAGRCLTLGEGTACVFHSMRVLEHGLRALATKVGLPADAMAQQNWQNVIDQIEKKIRSLDGAPNTTPDKSKKLKQYSSAATQFRYFKDAWRNHVSHSRDFPSSRIDVPRPASTASRLNVRSDG